MTESIKRLSSRAVIIMVFCLGIVSCDFIEPPVAELMTDVPQMAIYAAAFNTSQNRYKIHVSYEAHLAEKFASRTVKPALVIGRYLKSAQARSSYQSLDHLFSELVINQSVFYPGLLELGNTEGRQLFLPVSFNLPLIVFDMKLELVMKDGFVIDIVDLEKQGADFNKAVKSSYTNMGFDPRWSPEFLYLMMELQGTEFKEGSPLKWNKAGLEAGLSLSKDWSARSNGSIGKVDEFQFKYLYLPGYKSVQEGRIGFAAMNSSEFFIVSEERRSSLSFRWLSKDNAIPVDEGIVYAGISRKGTGTHAAEAFLKWFYAEETQRSILDEAQRYRSMESSFGIAGGFSAIRSVNEKLFPLYYPSLLGKLPPAQYLRPPHTLPAMWPEIKEEIILPFLLEATGIKPPADPNVALETRIQNWLKRRSTD